MNPTREATRPHHLARRSAELRQVALEQATREDVILILAIIKEQALKGNLSAARLWLSYSLAKPGAFETDSHDADDPHGHSSIGESPVMQQKASNDTLPRDKTQRRKKTIDANPPSGNGDLSGETPEARDVGQPHPSTAPTPVFRRTFQPKPETSKRREGEAPAESAGPSKACANPSHAECSNDTHGARCSAARAAKGLIIDAPDRRQVGHLASVCDPQCRLSIGESPVMQPSPSNDTHRKEKTQRRSIRSVNPSCLLA